MAKKENNKTIDVDKKQKNIFKIVLPIFFVVLLVFSMILFLNTSMTGRVIEGGVCTSPSDTNCVNTNLFVCINGEWKDVGEIPGQCGFTENSYSGGSTPSEVEGNEGIDFTTPLIILLIILILAVIGFILYKFVYKNNKKRNKGNFKNFPPGKKPILMRNPIYRGASPSVSHLQSDVKRYLPPKR